LRLNFLERDCRRSSEICHRAHATPPGGAIAPGPAGRFFACGGGNKSPTCGAHKAVSFRGSARDDHQAHGVSHAADNMHWYPIVNRWNDV
jgi:hypothetical protein